MTASQLKSEIADYQDVLDDPESSALAKELAAAEIAELEKQLAAANESKSPSGAPKKRAAKEEKPDAAAKAALRDLKRQAREEKKAKRKPGEPYTAQHVDRDGNEIALGDTVNATVGGKTYKATLTSLRRMKNGGYGVKFTRDGKTATAMIQPSAIQFVSKGGETVLHHMEPLPEKVVKNAQKVKRTDCDEKEGGILVTPTQKVKVDAPMVADPDKGDRILAHPDGTPVAVIKGEEAKKHFRPAGKVEIEGNPDGTVSFEETPEVKAAEEKKDATEKPDRKVRASKPPADCEFLKTEADDANALQTFMEGMRQRWRDADTEDKILRVLLRKSDNRVVLEIKRHGFLDIPIGTAYYLLCLNTGKMTKTDKPDRSTTTVLHGEEKMRDFYRYPNQNTCRRASRELYVTCYRDGACDLAKKTRLQQIVNQNCRKREDELSRGYRKFLHNKTAERWQGYKGDKSYYEIYREVIADLKAGKKV